MQHKGNRLSARQRGYTTRWDREAAAFKKRNPICTMCKAEGRVTQTYAVDHIVPHRGDPVLFNDQSNWQPLCRHHHNKVKQGIEHRGFDTRIDTSGTPTDPAHPWNKRDGGESKKKK